eukprot:307730-Prymnesium_polylepis.1
MCGGVNKALVVFWLREASVPGAQRHGRRRRRGRHRASGQGGPRNRRLHDARALLRPARGRAARRARPDALRSARAGRRGRVVGHAHAEQRARGGAVDRDALALPDRRGVEGGRAAGHGVGV